MKKVSFVLAAILVLNLFCAAAFAAGNEKLLDLWLKYCDSGSDGYYTKAFKNGEMKVNSNKVSIGAVIDGCEVWSGALEDNYILKQNAKSPYTAQDLLLFYPIPKGDICWTTGLLGDVEYRYGESKVRLKDSCIVGITENSKYYQATDSVFEIYEFEIRTGSKVFDLLVGELQGGDEPEVLTALLPGSDTLGSGGSLNIIGEMEVGNCEEWVSLRTRPDSNSERIMKVYKYALVLAYGTNGEFTACNVDGVDGWIQTKYLSKTDYELYEYETDYLRSHPWRG